MCRFLFASRFRSCKTDSFLGRFQYCKAAECLSFVLPALRIEPVVYITENGLSMVAGCLLVLCQKPVKLHLLRLTCDACQVKILTNQIRLLPLLLPVLSSLCQLFNKTYNTLTGNIQIFLHHFLSHILVFFNGSFQLIIYICVGCYLKESCCYINLVV